MTEPIGPEQEMPVLPENKVAEAKVEDSDLQKSAENNADKQSSELPAEADLITNSESVETSAERNLTEESDKVVEEPLEKPTGETPWEKPTDDTPLEKPTEGMPLEKPTDGTPLEMQTDETPWKKQTDGMPLEMQQDGKITDDTPLEKPTDDTPLVKQTNDQVTVPITQMETGSNQTGAQKVKTGDENEAAASTLENKTGSVETGVKETHPEDTCTKTPLKEEKTGGEYSSFVEGSNRSFTFEPCSDGDGSGTEEEQVAFVKKLEDFYLDRGIDFKPPKFYGEEVNCLKLWRTVTRLGGYDKVTANKLWRQVGESFNPPKTCTTVSWTFRSFYEKALFIYDKWKVETAKHKSMANLPRPMSVDNQVGREQVSSAGRVKRKAAARAMQEWHTKGFFGYESNGTLKKRKYSDLENSIKFAKADTTKQHMDIMVVDAGFPADWVKINVLRNKQFFEVYALVPGLLREEVQVQADPVGRLIISGKPEHLDNPWGITPFKKVITLSSRIHAHRTTAAVTLRGQLVVRAPIEE